MWIMGYFYITLSIFKNQLFVCLKTQLIYARTYIIILQQTILFVLFQFITLIDMYILPFGIPKYPPGWNIPARQNEFNINNQLKVMWRSNQFVKTGIGDCRYSFIYWNNDFSELDESINIKSTTVKSHTHTKKKPGKNPSSIEMHISKARSPRS